jgi:hypothetical protein
MTERPRNTNPEQDPQFGADLKQALATGERTPGEDVWKDYWRFRSEDDKLSVKVKSRPNPTEFPFQHLRNNGDGIVVPHGLIEGDILLSNGLWGDLCKGDYSRITEDFTEFFKEMDKRKAQGEKTPAILSGYTEKWIAGAVEKLGFYREELQNDFIIASTETVREKVAELQPHTASLE